MGIKRIIVVVLSMLLCMTTLFGCGSGSGKYGNTVVTTGPNADEIILKMGDEIITVKDFRYYVYMAAVETAYSIDPNISNDLSSFDWSQTSKNGKPIKNEIIENALKNAVRDSILIEKAKENGIFLSEDEKKQNNQSIESSIAQNGEKDFLLTANAMGISDVDGYKKLANRMMAAENAKKEISDNTSKYLEDGLDLSSWKSDDTVTAQHILIMNESEKHSDPEATAREVLAKAEAGEDFASLIKEYNEDPGATEAGYTFGRGEMVKEFEEASFALECGKLSDVVKTEFGYHVIRRLTGYGELVNYWVENCDYEVNKEILAEISVEDIINAVNNARKELQDMNTTEK